MYHNLVFCKDGMVKVQPELIDLLKLACPSTLNEQISNELLKNPDNTLSLKRFVELTQELWIRKIDNRWDVNNSIYDNNQKTITDIIDTIGLLNGRELSQKQYDGAVMLGGSITNMAKRFFHLQDQLTSNHYFKKIFLVGSEEDITQYLARIKEIHAKNPERFVADIKLPEKASEHEVLNFFISNLVWPDHFKHTSFIQLPLAMKKTPEGKLIKPNTQDAFIKLNEHIKTDTASEAKLKLAVFSSEPFTARQHLTSLLASQDKVYVVETSAAAYNSYPALNELEVAINAGRSLDELARLAFQLQDFINNVPDYIEKLTILDAPKANVPLFKMH